MGPANVKVSKVDIFVVVVFLTNNVEAAVKKTINQRKADQGTEVARKHPKNR